ncbi:putative diguanylate cyclase YegE [Aquimixticola soesokkakensis]|uniref:diguanylate cyclase n=1 Tax=Aquimixticola soesokkakensis TaxID=1519096 RepID=A0A1Y5SDU8_9RHOB|nr:GGDEF domain-containing protein [Aquimixticola soesokkakensis]SLN37404.1 putative diguanylate cyclase YegE [Aquimixticola soesokkakensis]
MTRQPLTMTNSVLDTLMPMHLLVSACGTIRRAGPTMSKLREGPLAGQAFSTLFTVRRSRRDPTGEESFIPLNQKLHLVFCDPPKTSLKGIAVPVLGSSDILINLSFGLSVVDAVTDYELNSADFAATEMAIEMLYLVEAKSAVLEETKQLNARLQGAKIAAEEQAYTDTLTGLKNRRAMDHVMERMTSSKVRFGLMHIDLDYFKSVNDTYGHAAGDAVLQTVGRILSEETRGDDMAARVGGDEFVLIFNRFTEVSRLVKTAERIIERLEVPTIWEDAQCRISGSIGITTSDFYDTPDVARMLADADAALYLSKDKGRACVSVHDPAVGQEAKGAPLGPPADRAGQQAGRLG